MKYHLLFLVCLLFFSFLVISENNADEDIDKVLDSLKEKSININIPESISSSYDSDSGILTVGKSKIDINKLKEYQKLESGSLGKYEFGGKSYDKPTNKVSSIEVKEDSVTYNYNDESSINIPDGASFDPMKRKFKIGEGPLYEWIGKGSVKVNKEGNVKLSFIENKNDNTDMTNFPIIILPSGQEISPFQNPISEGFKLANGIEKPSQGYVVFNQEGKLYSIRSDGNVNLIEVSEFKIENGKVIEAEKVYLNDERGRIFAVDKFSLSKKEGNYLVFENDGLFVNGEKSHNSFYFEMKGNLKTLDIKGRGVVKNGDKFLYFKGEKMEVKTLDNKQQKNNGDFLYKIEEIIMYKEGESSNKAFKIIPGKDGKLNLYKFEGDNPIDKKTEDPQPPGGNDEKSVTKAHDYLNEFRKSMGLRNLEHNDKMKEAADRVGKINLQRGGPGHPISHGYAEISHYVPCNPNQKDAEILKFAIHGSGGYVGFMGSSGHKRLLTSNSYSRAGVSVVRNSQGNRAAVTVTFS
jgi:hypothetical protein